MRQKLLSRSSVLFVLDMDPEVFDRHIAPYLNVLELDDDSWYDPDDLQELLDSLWGRKTAVVLEFAPVKKETEPESTNEE